MRSESSGTIHSSQINAPLQTAGQQNGIGAAVPKTLEMSLTKHMCESTLSLSRSACAVIRPVVECRRTCVPATSIASHFEQLCHAVNSLQQALVVLLSNSSMYRETPLSPCEVLSELYRFQQMSLLTIAQVKTCTT